MPKRVEHIEPDYSTAAEAWMVMEMTKEVMRHRSECVRIAIVYAKRLEVEVREGNPQQSNGA